MKRFNIGTVKMAMEANGFPKGFILKREPTIRESMYILQEILGFANDDYKNWFDDTLERQNYRKDCQFALTQFLKGEGDWQFLCNETQCYDYDADGFMMASAFSMASYLKKKGII